MGTNYISQSAMSDKNLGWALKNGDLDRVKEIIEADKSLVKTTIDGRTTLHLAADYGQLEVLEYLAAQGADIDAKDKHGIPDVSSFYSIRDVLKMEQLLMAGATWKQQKLK